MAMSKEKGETHEERIKTLGKRIKGLEEEVTALKDRLEVLENQKPVNIVLYQSALRAQTVGNNKLLEEYLKHYRVPAETLR